MVYCKPGGQTEHVDTVIDADFRLRPWRYQYPTVDRKSHLEFLRNGEIEVNKFREEELYVALKKFQHEGQDRWSTRFFLLKGHRP